MILTHLVFFEFLVGASASSSSAVIYSRIHQGVGLAL